MKPLGDWPMSHLVMLTGIVLALVTGAKVLGAPYATPWTPPESWLLFIMGCLTITFGIKRTTHEGLWRKAPANGTTTTETTTKESTTTKGVPPIPS